MTSPSDTTGKGVSVDVCLILFQDDHKFNQSELQNILSPYAFSTEIPLQWSIITSGILQDVL